MSAFDDIFSMKGMGGMSALVNLSPSRKKKRGRTRQSDPFEVLQMPKTSRVSVRKQQRRAEDPFRFEGFFGGVRSNGNGKKRNGNGVRRQSAKEAAMGFESPEFFGGLQKIERPQTANGIFDAGMMTARPVESGLGIEIPELGREFNTRFGRIGSGFVESVDPTKVGFDSQVKEPSGLKGLVKEPSGLKGLSELEREAQRREVKAAGRKRRLSAKERKLIALGTATEEATKAKEKALREEEKAKKRKEKERAKLLKQEEKADKENVKRIREKLSVIQEQAEEEAISDETLSDLDLDENGDEDPEEEKRRFRETGVDLGEGTVRQFGEEDLR